MLYDPKWETDGATQVLLGAADYIEKHGWCRGGMGDLAGEGPVCMLGAIIMAIRKNGGFSYAEIIPRLKAYLNRRHISSWNDHVCDSATRAIATLRAAAFYK